MDPQRHRGRHHLTARPGGAAGVREWWAKGARQPALVTIAAAVVLTTWPVGGLTPTAGLDASWQAGLHIAARRGLDFGTEVVFTYGPLGFLGHARLFYSATGVAALIYAVAVHAFWVTTVFVAARRSVPVAAAALAAYVVGALTWSEPAQVVPLAFFVWTAAVLQRLVPARWTLTLMAAGGAIAGLQLLVKFNTGLECGGMLFIAAVFHDNRRRALLLAIGSATVMVVLGWLVTGQSLAALPQFVVRSLSVARGYSTAMASEDPNRAWEYGAGLLVVVVTLALAWVAARADWRPRAVPMDLLMVFFVFAQFKHGFVRHDAHSISFFLGGLTLPLAFRWTRARWWAPATALGVAAICLALVIDQPARVLFTPVRKVSQAVDQLETAASGARRTQVMDQARAAMTETVRLDGPAARELSQHRVHVDPYETSVVWAYGLPWSPAPVFQTYSAYTQELDELNAARLAARSGPDRVLRVAPIHAIDFRNPGWESPEYMLTLVCRFREGRSTERWTILRRVASRCGDPEPVGRATVTPGETITVPSSDDPAALVFARIHLDESVIQSVTTAVYKDTSRVYVVADDGARYRVVEDTADGPLLMHTPPAAGFSPGFGVPEIRSFRVVGAAGATIEFFRVALR